MVAIDEAHHGPAKKWAQLKDRYPNALIVGLTATPMRCDGKPLGDVFDHMIVGATVSDLTGAGYLVPCEVWAPQLAQSELAQSPASLYLEKRLFEQKTVVFCDQIKSAEKFQHDIRGSGYDCALIHGKLPHLSRERMLTGFRSGGIKCLVNVGVLTEGWDDPGVTDCILARKCDSIGLYWQIIGRILRTHPGKTLARLYDLTGACRVHGLPGSKYEYSLDGEPISCQEKGDAVKQCLNCGRVFVAKMICPVCQKKLGESRKEIKVKRAELQRVFHEEFDSSSAERKLEMIEKYHASINNLAKSKGWKDGAVWNRMIAKFPGHETIIRMVMQ
jgi:superfamily II DNA or RNA helicase